MQAARAVESTSVKLKTCRLGLSVAAPVSSIFI